MPLSARAFTRLCFLCTLATTAAGAQTTLHLLPAPREITPKGDQAIRGAEVVCNSCDADDSFAANDLRQALAERGIPSASGTGVRIILQRLAQHPDPRFTAAMQPEGYTIAATADGLVLTGATATGVFYAAQTAKQLIAPDGRGGFVLHAADIRDWPAMRYRGLQDDLSRGPVSTLEFQKKLVRTLAAYKANVYSPYFEHTQQYASNPVPAPPGGSVSADDARELVAYARRFHLIVVPDQEAFGHLHHTLTYEQFADIAETPHGAVLAPGQPGSLQMITQEFTELARLYPGPFLHIGADETQDLGLGRSKAVVDAQGLAPVYLDFVQRIDTALAPLNRRILFWGDIAQDAPPALLQKLPSTFKQNTIAVAWWYDPRPQGFSRYLKPFTEAGFETWVAPGVNNWSRVYPNYNYALANIQGFTRDGQAAGSTGQLNAIWYDDGEALASNNWYGILFGASAAWQAGQSSIPDFEASYGPVFHGDLTGKLNQAQKEIMAAHDLLHTSAKVGDGSDGLFWIDPWAKDGQPYAAKIRPYTHELRLHAERALQLIAEARAANPAPPVPPTPDSHQIQMNATTLREPDAINALELGARRLDLIGLKFQLCDEMAASYARAQAEAGSTDKKTRASVSHDLNDIRSINGRLEDIIDGYSLSRDLYEQLWLRTNRPYALRPVLEHYDYTIGLWWSRVDKVRSAQRQWDDSKTLPSAAELGIPAPPPSMQ